MRSIAVLKMLLGLVAAASNPARPNIVPLPVVHCVPEFHALSGSHESDIPSANVAARVALYRELILDLTSRPAPFVGTGGKWTCLTGGCMWASAQLVGAVHRAHPSLERLVTKPFPGQTDKSKFFSNGRELTATHYFVVDRSLGAENEIIIDPTIGQWFQGPHAGHPIFIGTRQQLHQYFIENQNRLINLGSRVEAGTLDPVSYADFLYGFGQWSTRRQDTSDDGAVRTYQRKFEQK